MLNSINSYLGFYACRNADITLLNKTPIKNNPLSKFEPCYQINLDKTNLVKVPF